MAETLGILLESGAFSRAHHAFSAAAAAAAMGRAVIVFATNAGVGALAKSVPPGWEAADTAAMAAGVAGIEELREACAALGVRMLACEAGMRIAGVAAHDLREGVEISGIPTFLGAARGQIITL